MFGPMYVAALLREAAKPLTQRIAEVKQRIDEHRAHVKLSAAGVVLHAAISLYVYWTGGGGWTFVPVFMLAVFAFAGLSALEEWTQDKWNLKSLEAELAKRGDRPPEPPDPTQAARTALFLSGLLGG